ncbi:MAG: pyridoxal phosphate-dependent decarboxylase family protein [Cellulomonas sp.]
MTEGSGDFEAPLGRAVAHARAWLDSVPERRVAPETDAAALAATLSRALPEGPLAAEAVIDELAAAVEPGLMAFGSGRFFGWVVGGTQPAPLAADWLVSTWDQNAGMLAMSPGLTAVEDVAGRWLLDLLGLPVTADVGFVTGATSANLTCLAAARRHVLAAAGWDVEAHGLAGGPRVRVLVGAERHVSVDLALRYLGLGAAESVAADAQGRIDPVALAAALADPARAGEPTIVVLQAGNVHSGAADPMPAAIAVAHTAGAWVHVDGAFGLWAAATPALRPQLVGVELADSWATDAHKTLNVPYDCGVAIVADPRALRGAMGAHAAYLDDFLVGDAGDGGGHMLADPVDTTPEMSRRARGVPVWAALRASGRSGVVARVDGLVTHARALAAGIGALPGAEVLNEVVFTQVCVAFGDDARTRAVIDALLAGGEVWMSGSRWHERDVLRISVSNWATTPDDVTRAVAAVRAAVVALVD